MIKVKGDGQTVRCTDGHDYCGRNDMCCVDCEQTDCSLRCEGSDEDVRHDCDFMEVAK